MTTLIWILIAAAIVASYLAGQILRFRKYEGKMLVTCPETGKPAAVKVNFWRAVWASLRGRRRIELASCSRWPERADCDQDCVCEIESNPEAHQAWTIAAKWFEGKRCTYCGVAIPGVKHLDRMPALLNLEKKTFEWNQLPVEDLPDALEVCKPVCWNCHIAETFVREHPELVTPRPWKKSGPMGEYTPEEHRNGDAPRRHAA
ncbi:MAG TPA: hypothetical protein VMV61_00720 [Patescibacteria group bacterium]|nr:hypothetical protein [Patescibacteria group bacterium]